MDAAMSRLDYGNGETGASIDTFWLDGALRISAVEQVRFLARLARGQLPFPGSVQEGVREMIRLERREGRDLYAKTGWENAPDQGVGWWGGWVQQADRVYAFALNIDIRQPGDADRRVELGRASLEALGKP